MNTSHDNFNKLVANLSGKCFSIIFTKPTAVGLRDNQGFAFLFAGISFINRIYEAIKFPNVSSRSRQTTIRKFLKIIYFDEVMSSLWTDDQVTLKVTLSWEILLTGRGVFAIMIECFDQTSSLWPHVANTESDGLFHSNKNRDRLLLLTAFVRLACFRKIDC